VSDLLATTIGEAIRPDVAVTTSGRTGRRCEWTTVFWTSDNVARAQALNAFDDRFSVVASNHRGLSEALDLDVVIGADWSLTERVGTR
jgi:hypothetical protein